MNKKIILLTGSPGIGKTTIIKNILEYKRDIFGGFFTEEIRKNNMRLGFRLITIDGRSCIMAHRDIKSKFKVGKYGVNLECIERIGVDAIKNAIAQGKIVVIDEIGKMELFSNIFKVAVIDALNSSSSVIGTIPLSFHPFCEEIKNRYDVQIIEVTMSNREGLANKLISSLFP
uniref:NTPase n=1 Tax=candidate division WOR-3 bacterium TaxID=2052148 RepID=A0A7C4UDQ1_UNCW3